MDTFEKIFVSLGVLWIALFFAICITWVINLTQLTDCDFEPDYKCEVIHGVGLIPAASLITVWFDTDE